MNPHPLPVSQPANGESHRQPVDSAPRCQLLLDAKLNPCRKASLRTLSLREESYSGVAPDHTSAPHPRKPAATKNFPQGRFPQVR